MTTMWSCRPADPSIVLNILNQLKSQGIFDQFRYDCLTDVDTKPSYQNLTQRVDGFVTKYLTNEEWNPDLNKNELRNKLRKEIEESGMLSVGIDHVVDQVVNSKIHQVFLPRIREIVQQYFEIKPSEMKVETSNVSKDSEFGLVSPLKVEAAARKGEESSSYKDYPLSILPSLSKPSEKLGKGASRKVDVKSNSQKISNEIKKKIMESEKDSKQVSLPLATVQKIKMLEKNISLEESKLKSESSLSSKEKVKILSSEKLAIKQKTEAKTTPQKHAETKLNKSDEENNKSKSLSAKISSDFQKDKKEKRKDENKGKSDEKQKSKAKNVSSDDKCRNDPNDGKTKHVSSDEKSKQLSSSNKSKICDGNKVKGATSDKSKPKESLKAIICSKEKNEITESIKHYSKVPESVGDRHASKFKLKLSVENKYEKSIKLVDKDLSLHSELSEKPNSKDVHIRKTYTSKLNEKKCISNSSVESKSFSINALPGSSREKTSGNEHSKPVSKYISTKNEKYASKKCDETQKTSPKLENQGNLGEKKVTKEEEKGASNDILGDILSFHCSQKADVIKKRESCKDNREPSPTHDVVIAFSLSEEASEPDSESADSSLSNLEFKMPTNLDKKNDKGTSVTSSAQKMKTEEQSSLHSTGLSPPFSGSTCLVIPNDVSIRMVEEEQERTSMLQAGKDENEVTHGEHCTSIMETSIQYMEMTDLKEDMGAKSAQNDSSITNTANNQASDTAEGLETEAGCEPSVSSKVFCKDSSEDDAREEKTLHSSIVTKRTCGRQRKLNPKYTSSEYTSIFSECKSTVSKNNLEDLSFAQDSDVPESCVSSSGNNAQTSSDALQKKNAKSRKRAALTDSQFSDSDESSVSGLKSRPQKRKRHKSSDSLMAQYKVTLKLTKIHESDTEDDRLMKSRRDSGNSVSSSGSVNKADNKNAYQISPPVTRQSKRFHSNSTELQKRSSEGSDNSAKSAKLEIRGRKSTFSSVQQDGKCAETKNQGREAGTKRNNNASKLEIQQLHQRSSKRYDSSDLYKPRPVIHSGKRRNRAQSPV